MFILSILTALRCIITVLIIWFTALKKNPKNLFKLGSAVKKNAHMGQNELINKN